MQIYDDLVEKNHNTNCRYILNYSIRILIIGSSGSDKTIVLLNLINIYTSKIYLNQSINYLSTGDKNQGLKN